MPNAETIDGVIDFVRQHEKNADLQAIRDGLQMITLHRKVDYESESYNATLGLTPRQFEVLEILYFNPAESATPATLSDEVGLTRSAMTSVLDSLEKPGHVSRSPHPRDRRMISICLTPSGREFIEERLPERYRRIARVVGQLSPHERDAMIRTYTKILKAISEDLAEGHK